jgi:fluoride exporter
MLLALGVALAGAAGAVSRLLVDAWVTSRLRPGSLPWGTAAVNVSGTLLLGLLVGAARADRLSSGVLVVLGTGFCAAYTTFSTWMVETVALGRARRVGAVLLTVAGPAASGAVALLVGLGVGSAG